jgi:hypothetical protein
MSDIWSAINPMSTGTGTVTNGTSTDVASGGLGQVGLSQATATLNPQHPLFWFGAFAAVTLGLIGASTHLRVGPFRVDADAGKD